MEKTVGRCHVVVEWGSCEYEQIIVDARMTVAICGLKFIKFFVRMTVMRQFWITNLDG